MVENHLISPTWPTCPSSSAVRRLPARPLHAGEEGRHVPAECIVRGYLWQRPSKSTRSRALCAASSRRGLVNSSKLPEPIFTPSTKAEIGDHDENISHERLVETSARTTLRSCATLRWKVHHGARPRGRARRSSPTRSSSSAA
ncbi:MAG: phosphoribosylaminoimidazolesuccinocarboxamide synthase [Eggerthellaceae bacterium]